MKKVLAILLISLPIIALAQNAKVKTGDKAINFKLDLIGGESIKLSQLYKEGPVVLIVLRGWPEYQCPICTRQVGEFIAGTDQFKASGARVLFVYPGPSEVLLEKATEFASDFSFPDGFFFALDPNYKMINKYGLRWDAPKETAYPSTFVINKKGTVIYSKVSSTHGDRSDVTEVAAALEKL
ncbi:peroxiredoxin family protein [Maribellus sediminis]|uniref:peroxiredoxin family protein n=1 Tax=Maribellus sediminis TaxID=2696285 RepID=UPI001430A3D2|nr:peroxiredoxin family protein [Maribellus sediminis]